MIMIGTISLAMTITTNNLLIRKEEETEPVEAVIRAVMSPWTGNNLLKPDISITVLAIINLAIHSLWR